MITEHHIDLIQVSNSLDLNLTTGPRWGPRVIDYSDYFVSLNSSKDGFLDSLHECSTINDNGNAPLSIPLSAILSLSRDWSVTINQSEFSSQFPLITLLDPILHPPLLIISRDIDIVLLVGVIGLRFLEGAGYQNFLERCKDNGWTCYVRNVADIYRLQLALHLF